MGWWGLDAHRHPGGPAVAYYAAEGRSDKTDALTALIAAAKEKIRAEWPDGEEQIKVANHRIQDLEDAKKA